MRRSLEPSTASRSPRTRTASRNSQKALRMASLIPPFDAYLSDVFVTRPISLIYKLHCFTAETWLDSHLLAVMTIP
jgi:hypothetical protein